MFIIEYKIKAKNVQYRAIDEAIRTAQFVRNKALRFWMDNEKVNKYDLNKYCRVLAQEYPFAKNLNLTARQASAERAWSAISRFYKNCKRSPNKGVEDGKKGFPKFKKNQRSVEYKRSGWKLDEQTKKHITFTDKKGIGRLKLIGSRDIYFYSLDHIRRVRLIRRADGYYVQFCIAIEVTEQVEPTGQAVGLDVGLKYFYADSNGHTEPNSRFYRQGEKRLNRLNCCKSRKCLKGQKQSKNYHKARKRYAKLHLRISRQREEYAKRLACCVIRSNDWVAYEDLQIKNLVRNRHLSKSISDAGWYQFRKWMEYFGKKFGKITIAVPPHFTSQDCPQCGKLSPKSLSNRTHNCSCGFCEDREVAASMTLLQKAVRTVEHTETAVRLRSPSIVEVNASGDTASTVVGEILLQQVESLNEDPPDS
ncbi:transposase [Spirulina sp. CS-785/01]|uniref:RNA-guided endonuclease InsQ/TnpB family protein n=1 Tax=Spirulina sp. CS-785/01 TaxID=3021716 RepID=UPI00232C279C|nr:transposase [Spirulina sp. CS-785/01]MDB9313446.1 transposase [Spirulina sp. CS-785/01]